MKPYKNITVTFVSSTTTPTQTNHKQPPLLHLPESKQNPYFYLIPRTQYPTNQNVQRKLLHSQVVPRPGHGRRPARHRLPDRRRLYSEPRRSHPPAGQGRERSEPHDGEAGPGDGGPGDGGDGDGPPQAHGGQLGPDGGRGQGVAGQPGGQRVAAPRRAGAERRGQAAGGGGPAEGLGRGRQGPRRGRRRQGRGRGHRRRGAGAARQGDPRLRQGAAARRRGGY